MEKDSNLSEEYSTVLAPVLYSRIDGNIARRPSFGLAPLPSILQFSLPQPIQCNHNFDLPNIVTRELDSNIRCISDQGSPYAISTSAAEPLQIMEETLATCKITQSHQIVGSGQAKLRRGAEI
jgi:hypothetical protein